MANRNLPIPLEDYKLTHLYEWKDASHPVEGRSWQIRSWDKYVKVTLNWKFDAQGSTQLGGIDKLAMTIEEAVYLALREFDKWKEKFDAQHPG